MATKSTKTQAKAEKRIAIVAVHGVGDHLPDETSRLVVSLLSNISRRQERPLYNAFREETCEIPLLRSDPDDQQPPAEQQDSNAVKGSDDTTDASADAAPDKAQTEPPAATPVRAGKYYDERTTCVRALHEKLSGEPIVDEFGYIFMKERIEQTKVTIANPPYDTKRYKATRNSTLSNGGAPTPEADVHVYEMFWDDLSGVGKGFLAILGELYQILLHLPSIGSTTVDYARAAHPDDYRWKWRSYWQNLAARCLTIPIPILNLFLLAALFTALPGNLPDVVKPAVAVGAAILGVGSGLTLGVLRWAGHRTWWFWLIFILAGVLGTATAVISAYALAPSRSLDYFEKALAVEWWLAATGAIIFVAWRYSRLRNGAFGYAVITGVVSTLLFLSRLGGAPAGRFGATTVGLNVAEMFFVALLIYWSYFAICSWMAGAWVQWRASARERRAAFTGRISLALAVTGLLIFSLAVYSGLNLAAGGLLPDLPKYESILNRSLPHAFPKSGVLHEADFQSFADLTGERVATNPVDQFADYLRQSTGRPAERLLEKSLDVRQALTQYDYSAGRRAALVAALNKELTSSTPPESLGVRPANRDEVWKQAPPDELESEVTEGASRLAPTTGERIDARRDRFDRLFAGYVTPFRERRHLYPSEIVDRMLTLSATPALAVSLMAIAFALLLALLAVLPSVLSEAVPALRRSTYCGGMGEWLTSGFRLMRASGELLYWPIIVLLPLGSMLYFTLEFRVGEQYWTGIVRQLSIIRGIVDIGLNWSREVVQWLGLAVASSAVGLFAFRGKLESLALGLRPPLQAALDVDNWMRVTPVHDTPRGNISVRFMALLRALVDEKSNPDGRPYDAVVIVAHSQGTVITADLLRFLNWSVEGENGQKIQEKDRYHLTNLGKEECPVYFLTVGSPLQQAYALRFPHLYSWTRDEEIKRREAGSADVISARTPHPRELGLKRWVSAYRSGDYIGRSFWFCDQDQDRWTVEKDKKPFVSRDSEGSRREVCIGAGAHVHYFNLDTEGGALIVATQLDQLIVEAITGR
jgi:hypothetical protein